MPSIGGPSSKLSPGLTFSVRHHWAPLPAGAGKRHRSVRGHPNRQGTRPELDARRAPGGSGQPVGGGQRGGVHRSGAAEPGRPVAESPLVLNAGGQGWSDDTNHAGRNLTRSPGRTAGTCDVVPISLHPPGRGSR